MSYRAAPDVKGTRRAELLIEIENTIARAREFPYLLRKIDDLKLELAALDGGRPAPQKDISRWVAAAAVVLVALVVGGVAYSKYAASEKRDPRFPPDCKTHPGDGCVIYDKFN
jgi:hypothetical protein